MKITRNLKTKANRKFWETVDACAEDVKAWPEWKQDMPLKAFLNHYRTGKIE